MAYIAKASNAGGFKSLNRYYDMLAGNDTYIENSYESIATITASGGETSLAFTSISQIYTHLQMRYFIRGTDSGSFSYSNISINGNSYGTNYSGHTLQGDGSAAGATNIVSGGGIGNLYSPGAGATANVFASGIVDLLEYTNTNKNKVIRVLHGHDTNGGGQIIFGGGQLLSTSTVTGIGIFNMTFAAGSKLALYGIRG